MTFIKHQLHYFFFAVLAFISFQARAMRTDTLRFNFEGKRFVGFLDQPDKGNARALVVIVPGSGRSNVVLGNTYKTLRSRLTGMGLGVVLWDKAGCGKSEGEFNEGQSVYNSAAEVIAAMQHVQAQKIPGSEKIGLWGISRAGWICPLVIEKFPVTFWISVSGTDEKETFAYLLEKNIGIESGSTENGKALAKEWVEGLRVARNGGSFETYLKTTERLRQDSFYIALTGGTRSPENYREWVTDLISTRHPYDEESGLMIYVTGFEEILKKINCPVLALFGEKDSQVDWQRTLELYKKTLGNHPSGIFSYKVLPDCNHNMLQCKSGAYREKLKEAKTCEGYYETMLNWLSEKVPAP